MLRKVILCLFISLSIFFASYKVNAAGDDTNTVYFDLENSRFTSVYDSIKPKLEEIVDYLKNNNPNNHNWAVYFGRDNSGAFVYLNLLPSDFSGTFSSGNYCLSSAAVWNNSYYYMYGGCQTNQVYSKKHTFRINDDISSLKTDMSLPFSSISGMSTGSMYMQLHSLNAFTFTNNQYDYFSNNVNFILSYASTVNLYNYSSLQYYRLKIGDNELSTDTNTYLEPSDNYFGKKYDTYTLSNLEYSAIEVKFNINDFPMIDEGNDINLEYEIKLDTDMIISLLPIPQEKIYRNMALGDYSIGTTMNLLFDEKANNYVYEGTKHYDYWNTITYRFEFPFTNDYVGNITLNFWSDSNYTITLEERSNEENDIKYTELDLTGKYGVGFIPKVSSFDVYNEFYGIFKVPYQNNYRLMFYKDYSYVSQNNKSNLILDKVLLTFENFEYKFTKENKNSYLLFINNNYEDGSEASILYNSNYFNYCILDEELSSCDIVNPNTDENVTINPNLGDLDSFGVKDILHSFKTFSNSTNFILENVTNFYNNFLPDELKIFFFISFGFAVIIMITKIVL